MSKLSKPNTSLEEARPFQGMSLVNQNAAGVDIGAHEIMVCVPGPDNTQLVRSFGNYTADLYAIAKWLGENTWLALKGVIKGLKNPLYSLLESHNPNYETLSESVGECPHLSGAHGVGTLLW